MNRPLKFTKMHGLGNDFILIDNWDGRVENPAALARALCRRRLSAGADGLILTEPSSRADAKMHFFNADGSEAEMCGNGIRCFARFLHDQGLVRAEHMHIETLAGIMRPELVLHQGEVAGVKVDMGQAEFAPENVPTRGTGWGDALEAEGERLLVYSLRMGVPHAVILVENAESSAHTSAALGRRWPAARAPARRLLCSAGWGWPGSACASATRRAICS